MTSKIADTNFKIIAYRGGAETFPENSIEAIQESVNSYADTIIEIDLQLSKDNVVIVFHDFHLEKLTNGKGKVNHFTITELKMLFLKKPNGRISSVSKISTLDEIFNRFPNQSFVLDIHENNNTLFEKVIEVVEKNKCENRIAIVSIAKGATNKFCKLKPDWIFIASPIETIKFIIASKLSVSKFVKVQSKLMFLPDKMGGFKILNSKAIEELHRRNIKVWTCKNFKPFQNVNDIVELEYYRKINVNGIYTDNPKHLK